MDNIVPSIEGVDVVDFLDDINIDGTVTAKRVKLIDSAGDEKDVATKEYVDDTVDAKFDETVTSNGFATKDDLGMEREARERDINELNAVLTSKVNYSYFEEELRNVKNEQFNKDTELQTNIDMLRDNSNAYFATKQELEMEISAERSLFESAITYESDERSRADSQMQLTLANTEADISVLSIRVDELANTHVSDIGRVEMSISDLSLRHDSDIDSLRNRFEDDLRNLNYIETLTVNGIQQTVANRIVDVDLSNYATKTELSDKSDKLTCVTVEKDFYGDYYTHTFVLKNVSDHAIISGVVSYNNIRIPISGIFSYSHPAEYVLRDDIRVQKDSYTNCLDILVFTENGLWELAQPSLCDLDLLAINL